MRIIFLGTGTGIPEKNNSPSSLFVEYKNTKIIFDFGEGIMKNLIRKNIRINDIDAIFLTHFHIDHIIGIIPLLFAFRYEADPRKKEFFIFGPSGLKGLMEDIFKLFEKQLEPKSYKLKIEELKPGKEFKFKNIKIETFKTKHRNESIGYILNVKGKRIAYTGDTDYDETYRDIMKKVDILITECSVPIDIENHMNPQKVLKLIKDIYPHETYLIHLYPVMDRKKLKKYFHNKIDKKVIIPPLFHEIKI
ncbi:MAG: ribonuclease Z [candidate division WOR-3 bacterium]